MVLLASGYLNPEDQAHAPVASNIFFLKYSVLLVTGFITALWWQRILSYSTKLHQVGGKVLGVCVLYQGQQQKEIPPQRGVKLKTHGKEK